MLETPGCVGTLTDLEGIRLMKRIVCAVLAGAFALGLLGSPASADQPSVVEQTTGFVYVQAGLKPCGAANDGERIDSHGIDLECVGEANAWIPV